MCFCDHLTNESVNNYCFMYIFVHPADIAADHVKSNLSQNVHKVSILSFFCSKRACSYCLIFFYYQQLSSPENFLNASLTITDHFFLHPPVTSYDILCHRDIELNGNSQVFFLTKKCVWRFVTFCGFSIL